MISYKDAVAKAKQTLGERERPEPKNVWHAYKNKTYVGASYVSRADAEQHFNTKVVERVVENQDEIDAYKCYRQELEQQAFNIWYAALREEHGELSDKLFDICYAQAYDRGHSSGYDEVANCMYDVVEFAHKVRAV